MREGSRICETAGDRTGKKCEIIAVFLLDRLTGEVMESLGNVMRSIIYDLSAGAWVDRETGELVNQKIKCIVCDSRSENWKILYGGANLCICSEKCLVSYQKNKDQYDLVGNVPVRKQAQLKLFV